MENKIDRGEPKLKANVKMTKSDQSHNSIENTELKVVQTRTPGFIRYKADIYEGQRQSVLDCGVHKSPLTVL